MDETAYMQGERAAMLSIMNHCRRYLSPDEKRPVEGYISEIEMAHSALRWMCEEMGWPNDWSPNLHLGDVISKYIEPYVYELRESE